MLLRKILVTVGVTLLLLVSPVAANPALPTVVEEVRVGERLLDLSISSPAMGRVERARVLLPPGWSRHADRTWPVLYLLHGSGDDHTAWTANTDVERLTAGTDAIVVMPNGGRCGSYSNWWNGGRYGSPAWETFHLDELRGLLERHYRAGTERAIAGLSMGGQGAMTYAARRPGMFRAAASYSGSLHSLIVRPTWPSGIDGVKMMWLVCDLDWRNLWGDPNVPAQRVLWQQHNPYDLADRLRGVRLFVSSGNGEAGPLDPPLSEVGAVAERVAGEMSQAFTDRLRALNIPVTTDFYGNGRHSWGYWERALHRSLPMLLGAIGVPAGGSTGGVSTGHEVGGHRLGQ